MPKTKVAIIEDDLPILQLYRSKFEAAGYDVQTATDGQNGFDLLVSYQPNVILLDLMMPRVNGLELLDRIKHDDRINPDAVVVLTNVSYMEMAERMRGLPVTEYLVKANLTPNQVVTRVTEILAEQTAKK